MGESAIPKSGGVGGGESGSTIDIGDEIRGLAAVASKLEIFHPMEDREGKGSQELLIT